MSAPRELPAPGDFVRMLDFEGIVDNLGHRCSFRGKVRNATLDPDIVHIFTEEYEGLRSNLRSMPAEFLIGPDDKTRRAEEKDHRVAQLLGACPACSRTLPPGSRKSRRYCSQKCRDSVSNARRTPDPTGTPSAKAVSASSQVDGRFSSRGPDSRTGPLTRPFASDVLTDPGTERGPR